MNMPLQRGYVEAKVREALMEDASDRDVTTDAVVPSSLHASAHFIARSAGAVAGLPIAQEVFRQVDGSVQFKAAVEEGSRISAGQILARLDGPMASLLRGERTALNFVQQLSGVTTLTRRFVDAAGSKTVVLDTRKTVPGLRALQRYAVRMGGGVNHRSDLASALLVKDNHVAAAGGTRQAIGLARQPGGQLQIEVESLEELEAALAEGVDVVLLDNMGVDQVAEAVRLAAGRVVLEVSGGVSLATIGAYAATGVHRISVGALTHSAPALDVSMEVERTWHERARKSGLTVQLEADAACYRRRQLPPAVAELKEEVRRLARERKMVILAHNYQVPEVQDVADVVGDSLGLARAAAGTDARGILFCGVHFMAETAAILNPGKRVLLPDLEAGCSLAETIDAEQLRAWKARHPGAVVVTYVNTSAEVKAESDWCCTSGNAKAVIEAIPVDQPILFAPDMFLGTYLERITGRSMHVWPGECHVHAGIRPADLELARREHGDADLMVHPECGCASPCMYYTATGDLDSDRVHILSTEGMVQHARRSPSKSFVVATEIGILHRLGKEVPDTDKRFYAVSERAVCRYMKKITLPKLVRSLREGIHQITVPEPVASQARVALERMVSVG